MITSVRIVASGSTVYQLHRLRSGRASSLSLGKADSRDALYHCSASRIAYVAAGYHGRWAQSLTRIRGLWHIQGGGRPY
jgi:hypothetical protein